MNKKIIKELAKTLREEFDISKYELTLRLNTISLVVEDREYRLNATYELRTKIINSKTFIDFCATNNMNYSLKEDDEYWGEYKINNEIIENRKHRIRIELL